MGVDLTLSGHEPGRSMRLCTNQGFDLVAVWAKGLPGGKYPAVDAFFRDLSYEPTVDLAEQLNSAGNEHGPTDPVTAETLALLLGRLGVGRADETASIQV